MVVLAVVLVILGLLLFGGGIFIGSLKLLIWIGLALIVAAAVTGVVSRRR